MSIKESMDKIKALFEEAEKDSEKVDKGNKTAGVRLRKNLKTIKDDIEVVRKEVLKIRK